MKNSNSYHDDNDKDIQEILQKKLNDLQKKISILRTISQIKSPVIITDDTLKEKLSRYPYMVVDFWAPWCGPCKMLSPIIDQLAIDFTGKIVFGKVNVDENPILSNSFGIQSIPTIILFRYGNAVDRITGFLPKIQIEQKLNMLIKN